MPFSSFEKGRSRGINSLWALDLDLAIRRLAFSVVAFAARSAKGGVPRRGRAAPTLRPEHDAEKCVPLPCLPRVAALPAAPSSLPSSSAAWTDRVLPAPDAERRLSKEDAKGLMHTWLLRWQISRRRATAAQRKIWKMNLFCSVLELISASY